MRRGGSSSYSSRFNNRVESSRSAPCSDTQQSTWHAGCRTVDASLPSRSTLTPPSWRVENLEIAGVGDRVDVVVGDADEFLAKVEPASIGLVFLDGAKRSYPDYLKRCFPLLEPGGLLVADDAFADGNYDAERQLGADVEQEREAIARYARVVGSSPLLFSTLVPTSTGLMVSRRASR